MRLKPDFEKSMARIEAWYGREIVDRPPVYFMQSEGKAKAAAFDEKYHFDNLIERWEDSEYQLARFRTLLPDQPLLGDGFPVYMPNLGPNFFAACYGGTIEYTQDTSWTEHILKDGYRPLCIDFNNYYFQKIEEMTDLALEQADDEFLVGYTDLHPGLDCVASFRGSETLCMDLFEHPDQIKQLAMQTIDDYQKMFDHYNQKLLDHRQLSVSWMGIPSRQSMHIPSCDFSFMISPDDFAEFGLPVLEKELEIAEYNIFHVDGPGVARHIDAIAQFPQIQAMQWVQGAGENEPVMQWVPLIQKIQALGKAVVVYVHPHEIDNFTSAVKPQGIYLFIDEDDRENQQQILRKIEKWGCTK